MVEIERKFIVTALPSEVRDAPDTLAQAYLVTRPAEVRLRGGSAGTYRLTIKSGVRRDRTEVELPLSRQQFEALWPLAPYRLEKTRRKVAHNGHIIEVDVYAGRHAPLVVAEVEFTSAADAERFAPPPWFGLEVTDNGRFKNAALAQAGGPPEA